MGKNSSAFEVYKNKKKGKNPLPNMKKTLKCKKKEKKKIVLEKQKIKIPKLVVEDQDAMDFFNHSDIEEEVLINATDPIKNGKKVFNWMIHPQKLQNFFKEKWEKHPMHIKRDDPNYYKHLMSTSQLDEILRKNYLQFTKNIDITSFVNDTRETHNPTGRALPSVVWDYYLNGCSVRFLNPQTYIPKIHTLNATLQELFGCFVGANSYLTPPNSQGFAPHYDDIEAFILQIEGRKRWRVYKPPTPDQELPRFSSPNFSQHDLGEPVLDVVVKAGDLLYFPRGFIHQGDTLSSDKHSLHITISAYQKNSWGDFLEKLLPTALNRALESDKKFRAGLPLDYLQYTGFSNSEKAKADAGRQRFVAKAKELFRELMDKYLDVDQAADEMAKGHMHDFLPPVLDTDEIECSIYEGGERMMRMGKVVNRVEIEPDTRVRLTRSHCARLVEEEGVHRLYYSCDNSKEYHELEVQFLELDSEFVPALKMIITSYPDFVRVEDLPIDGLDKQIQIVQDLWEKGIVLGSEQLPMVKE